ncbi:hypothetical protein GCM10022286_25170 [Gryllotalpicola daejeonensis]|uniref:Uncharacterized protein n=2 Tax=Gryllotalpicola daejeonensis TaxID=993087 RepID=A0ABP7ZM62_9MICO
MPLGRSGYREGMTEMENGTHPQDPAEGADDDQQQRSDDRSPHPEQPAEGGDHGARQNEERPLNDGDDITQPGGEEPAD